MFGISILVAFVIGAICIVLVILQWKTMIRECDESSSMIQMYITMDYSPNLRFSNGFSNVISNIILKFVVFTVVAIILHLTRFSVISTIYGIAYLSLEIFKLSTRLREYKMNRPRNQTDMTNRIRIAIFISPSPPFPM